MQLLKKSCAEVAGWFHGGSGRRGRSVAGTGGRSLAPVLWGSRGPGRPTTELGYLPIGDRKYLGEALSERSRVTVEGGVLAGRRGGMRDNGGGGGGGSGAVGGGQYKNGEIQSHAPLSLLI